MREAGIYRVHGWPPPVVGAVSINLFDYPKSALVTPSALTGKK